MNQNELRAFDIALADCIDALKQGAQVEECLARYPHFAEQLAPYLLTATRVNDGLVKDRVSMTAASRAAVLARAQQASGRRAQRAIAPGTEGFFERVSRALRGPRLVFAGVALVLILVIGGIMVSAATPALPGEALYPVKRAAENIQLVFTFDHSARADLLLTLAERRSSEIRDLLARGLPLSPELLADLRNALTGALAEMAFASGETQSRLLERAIALTQTQINILSTAAQSTNQATSDELAQAAGAIQAINERAKEARKNPEVLFTSEPSPTTTGTSTSTPGVTNSTQTPEQPTLTPEPTGTQTGEDTPEPTKTPQPVGVPNPTPTSQSQGVTPEPETPSASRTPEPAGTEAATEPPRVTSTPNPSNTPEPVKTLEPTQTPNSGGGSPQPTQTRQPTQTPNSGGGTPQPTKTPEPAGTPHT